MKKAFIGILFMGLLLILVSCANESGAVYEGEGKYWNGELVTRYNFWGEEYQSIKIKYKGEDLVQLGETNISIESPDFLGWGIWKIELDEQGIFNSGEAIKLDSKTQTTSEILLKIEGEKPETISLSFGS